MAWPTTSQRSPFLRRASQLVILAGVVTLATAAVSLNSVTCACFRDSGTQGQSGVWASRHWAIISPVLTPRVYWLCKRFSIFSTLPSRSSMPPRPSMRPRESSELKA